MTKAERDRLVDEAIAWMLEDGFEPAGRGQKTGGSLVKFPGWSWDEKVARALLEAAVLGHPRINLIACLANMRANWIHLGRASARAWAARWRNWIKNDWDPLVSGRAESREPRAESGGERRFRPMPRPPASSPRPPAQPVPPGDVAAAELAKIKKRLGG